VVKREEQVLTLGPRWVGEIHYFRDVIGFSNAIGLDLFSKDTNLVRIGDMHCMPFADSTFGLVYQRNTFNKAYDIRKALEECQRVLRDGGILISDECLAYTDGVSEVGRTSITHNKWYLQFFGDAVEEVLRDAEAPSLPNDTWIERVGQIAIKLRKTGKKR
jgi:SAM-dependent methyltransferase